MYAKSISCSKKDRRYLFFKQLTDFKVSQTAARMWRGVSRNHQQPSGSKLLSVSFVNTPRVSEQPKLCSVCLRSAVLQRDVFSISRILSGAHVSPFDIERARAKLRFFSPLSPLHFGPWLWLQECALVSNRGHKTQSRSNVGVLIIAENCWGSLPDTQSLRNKLYLN